MPDRNKYPAFRDDLTIEQVRSAIAFLRAGDKYAAEKTIYPPQSKAALKDGFFLMLKAGHQAQKAEEVEQEFTQDS
jgi:hypothetical protein